MGKAIDYDQYVKDQKSICESAEATAIVFFDYIKYTVEHVNMSELTPEHQELHIEGLNSMLKGIKKLLNENEIKPERFFVLIKSFQKI